MRKFGMRYADWHPDADDVKADFIRVGDARTWNSVIKHWYTSDRPGVYPVYPGVPKPPASDVTA